MPQLKTDHILLFLFLPVPVPQYLSLIHIYVMKPDYGEAVDIYEGEIPVFWPCGVTPQAAIENAKLPIVITHAPGHMFITDILNSELNDYLEAQKNK